MTSRIPILSALAVVVLLVRPSAQEPAAGAFAGWLAGVRSEAVSRGISARTVDAALAGIDVLPVVVERDRDQPELKLTLDQYLKRRLTRDLTNTGRTMMKRHAGLLARVAARYGVEAPVTAAIWGLESNYGRFSGTRPTVATLVTLAYDRHRPALFREELFAALKVLDRGDIDTGRMKGSWAGAMGQPQFMPSSYLEFAVDFDGDRRADIWSSPADVFASIANYLAVHGWVGGQRWGRAVRMDRATAARVAGRITLRPAASCQALRDLSMPQKLSWWKQLGVKTAAGRALPSGDVLASLLVIDGRRYLVYANYEALLSYNCAHAYAFSVTSLADRLARR